MVEYIQDPNSGVPYTTTTSRRVPDIYGVRTRTTTTYMQPQVVEVQQPVTQTEPTDERGYTQADYDQANRILFKRASGINIPLDPKSKIDRLVAEAENKQLQKLQWLQDTGQLKTEMRPMTPAEIPFNVNKINIPEGFMGVSTPTAKSGVIAVQDPSVTFDKYGQAVTKVPVDFYKPIQKALPSIASVPILEGTKGQNPLVQIGLIQSAVAKQMGGKILNYATSENIGFSVSPTGTFYFDPFNPKPKITLKQVQENIANLPIKTSELKDFKNIPLIDIALIQSQLATGGAKLGGKVFAEIIPTTPLDIGIATALPNVYPYTPKAGRILITGGIATMGGMELFGKDVPIEKRIFGGLMLAGGGFGLYQETAPFIRGFLTPYRADYKPIETYRKIGNKVYTEEQYNNLKEITNTLNRIDKTITEINVERQGKITYPSISDNYFTKPFILPIGIKFQVFDIGGKTIALIPKGHKETGSTPAYLSTSYGFSVKEQSKYINKYVDAVSTARGLVPRSKKFEIEEGLRFFATPEDISTGQAQTRTSRLGETFLKDLFTFPSGDSSPSFRSGKDQFVIFEKALVKATETPETFEVGPSRPKTSTELEVFKDIGKAEAEFIGTTKVGLKRVDIYKAKFLPEQELTPEIKVEKLFKDGKEISGQEYFVSPSGTFSLIGSYRLFYSKGKSGEPSGVYSPFGSISSRQYKINIPSPLVEVSKISATPSISTPTFSIPTYSPPTYKIIYPSPTISPPRNIPRGSGFTIQDFPSGALPFLDMGGYVKKKRKKTKAKKFYGYAPSFTEQVFGRRQKFKSPKALEEYSKTFITGLEKRGIPYFKP